MPMLMSTCWEQERFQLAVIALPEVVDDAGVPVEGEGREEDLLAPVAGEQRP